MLKHKTSTNIKIKRLIKNIPSSSTYKQAMLKSGFSESQARNPGLTINKPSFQALLHEAGLTDELLAKATKDGLKAKYPIEYKGEVMSEYPDYSVRHKYLETTLKLKGHLHDNQINIQANDYKLVIEDTSDNTNNQPKT